jgi:hypothetical protein
MVQPGTAMTVKETRAGEACVIIIIITGPFLLSDKVHYGKFGRSLQSIVLR